MFKNHCKNRQNHAGVWTK